MLFYNVLCSLSLHPSYTDVAFELEMLEILLKIVWARPSEFTRIFGPQMVKFFYLRNFSPHNTDDRPESWGRRTNLSDLYLTFNPNTNPIIHDTSCVITRAWKSTQSINDTTWKSSDKYLRKITPSLRMSLCPSSEGIMINQKALNTNLKYF